MQSSRGESSSDDVSKIGELPKEHIDWFVKPITRFIKIEATSGAMLLLATIIALLFANSELSHSYSQFWTTDVGVHFGDIELKRTLHRWVNDGAMTVFFFLVALELKRELIIGELNSPTLAMLSIAAAIGGMLVPVLFFVLLQFNSPTLDSWGVVMSTDTAFVLGCLALLGHNIPRALRVFMLSLAVVDDIGAILVVAIGYSHSINWIYLGFAAIGLIVIRILTFIGVRSFVIFSMVGGAIWLVIDLSGLHPTITGVILGLMTPTVKWVDSERLNSIVTCITSYPLTQTSEVNIRYKQALKTAEAAAREALSPVERLENILHPWVGFVIMPLFALANAGVTIVGANIDDFFALSIFLSFVVGKPIGVMAFSWLAVKVNIATLPNNLNWRMIFGGSLLAGIGFTMALFVVDLSLQVPFIATAKLAILIASVTSAILGCLYLSVCAITSCQKK